MGRERGSFFFFFLPVWFAEALGERCRVTFVLERALRSLSLATNAAPVVCEKSSMSIKISLVRNHDTILYCVAYTVALTNTTSKKQTA